MVIDVFEEMGQLSIYFPKDKAKTKGKRQIWYIPDIRYHKSKL